MPTHASLIPVINHNAALDLESKDESVKPSIENASNTHENPSIIEQVEQIQAQILSEEGFDFSQLESTAAGAETPTSFASTPFIELSDNTIEFHNLSAQTESTQTSFEKHTTTEEPNTAKPNDDSGLLDTSPNIIGETFANVTEDFQTTLQGSINTNLAFNASTHTTSYGEVNIDDNGNWQYSLSNQSLAVQSLSAGDTLNETIEINAQNGASFFIEITVNGSNDRAHISGTTRELVTEDSINNLSNQTIEAFGSLNIEDVDLGEARFVHENEINTTYGTAEINALGEWRYTLDNTLNAVQSLTNETHLSDFFSVHSIDGTSQTIQIIIQGTDDSPLLSGSNRVEINLNISDSASGQLEINDPDFGESHFQAESNIIGRFGTGSIEENGQWSYQINTDHPDLHNLEADITLHDTFIVTTADGTEQTIIIPISNNPESIASTSQAEDINNNPIIELENNDQILALTTQAEHENTDIIPQFTAGYGGDTLQINDLLIETHTENELDQFLHFSFDRQDTTIEINTDTQGSEQHLVILNDTNLTNFGSSDSEIIQNLIQQGNLDIAGL